MLTGENGLIQMAKKVAEETEKASEEEQRQLTIAEATMNLNGTKYKSTYKDEEVIVPIPAGFAVSQVEGENTVEDGLVIIDSKGNEFVWVPVYEVTDNIENNKEKFSENFIRRNFYYYNTLTNYTFYNEKPVENECFEVNPDTPLNSEYVTDETINEVKAMYESVEKYGGFFIGRYETGLDSKNNIIIQKNENVYNNISWSESDALNNEKNGVVEKSRNFDSENNYTNSTTTLVYGVQMDAIGKWVENIDNPNLTNKKVIVDCTNYGWYNNNSDNHIHKTGEGNFKIKNIYDLGGNVWEWTMEVYGLDKRVLRRRRH